MAEKLGVAKARRIARREASAARDRLANDEVRDARAEMAEIVRRQNEGGEKAFLVKRVRAVFKD